MDENLKENYKFEEELLKKWKNPDIYNNDDKNKIYEIIKYAIGSLIAFIITMVIVINCVDLNKLNVSVIILLFLIVVYLVASVYVDKNINLKLSDYRNLEEFSNYLSNNNIKTIDDYDILIKRFKSKKEKLTKVELIDSLYSNAIIGVITFFIGGFLKGKLFNQISGEMYIVNTLFAILIICMVRLAIIIINNSLNIEYENLTLFVDDLERIKFVKENEGRVGIESDNSEISSNDLVFEHIDNIDDAIYKLERICLRLMNINKRVKKIFLSGEKDNNVDKDENSKDNDSCLSYKHTIYKEETRIK